MRRISQTLAVLGLFVLVGSIHAQDPSEVTAGDTCASFKRLWVGDIREDLQNFRYSTPSPDGRYVTEVDWTTGDLALRDLQTGELRRVTDKGKPWSESQDWGWYSVFSPDGSKLAYMWFVSRKGYEVRIIGVDGSGMRTVYDQPCWPRCRLEDWSEDGRHLLALIGSEDVSREVGHQEIWQLLMISVDDGSHRVLKVFDHRAPRFVNFSPDGRWVAYDRPSDRESGDWDVFLLSLDRDEEVVLLGGPEDDRLWGWMPDGGILLYSDRASTRGIWRLPVEGGRVVGGPSLIRGDLWKVWPLGFSRDAYLYGVVLEQPHVRIASIDLEALAIVGTPEPVSDPMTGRASDLAWSHDGMYLAYRMHRHPYLAYESERSGASDRLVIRSLGGEMVREIDVPLDEWGRIRWMPDGDALVLAGRESERNLGIFRLDIATEQLVPLRLRGQDSDEELEGYALSPDGATLYFGRWSEPTGEFVAHDLTMDRERVLMTYPRGPPGNLRPSPDGRWIGHNCWSPTEPDTVALAVVPAAGGEIRELYRALPAEIRPEFVWSPDSKQMVFLYWDAVQDDAALLTVSPLGGPPEKVRELGCYYCVGKERLEQGPESVWWVGGEIHPDGHRVAGVGGSTKGEIWVIENVLGKSCPP